MTIQTPTATPSADLPPAPPSREVSPSGTRWALAALLGLTAVLYLWGLGASGWANSYYSAAALAGSQSWTAFLFGSFDAANAISVDKAAASLWPMALSVRLFGLSSWSILVPQALMGVASVALLYASVRRWASVGAGLMAGLVLALTPVAALMFRFNNPDALLVLLLIVVVYATQRGIERASVRVGSWWFAAAGVALGFAFLTKMLQAFVIVPVLVAVVLMAAPVSIWRRVWQVGIMGLTTLVGAGWWVALVELTPAANRPYVGGSQTNSMLELIFGYNGLGRITGDEVGSVTPGGATGGSPWGETGWGRLFSDTWAGQASWLLPAALIMLVMGLWLTRRAPRTDRTRASLVIWGGWLLITAVVFSFAEGIIHEYYAVALAPAIAALVGIGTAMLWQRREHRDARVVLAIAIAITVGWSAVLLTRSSDWNPWLAPVVLLLGLGAAAVLVSPWSHRSVAGVVALVAVLLGPAAWTLQTVATEHSGSLPTAGPTVSAGAAGARGGGPAGLPGGGQTPPDGATGPTGGTAPDGALQGGQSPGGAPTGGGGMGGLLDAPDPSSAVVESLVSDADDYTWVAAAIGSQTAAGYQLATEEPVMAIGGFNGSDPYPTVAEFQQYVADGQIHWFVGGDGGQGSSDGGSNASAEISTWVAANFDVVEIDGTTLYDLSSGTGS